MKLSSDFFKNETVRRVGRGVMGDKMIILWLKILLNDGIDLTLPEKEQKKIFNCGTLTLRRGIRLFKELKLISKCGQIIENKENFRRQRREYMRAYRKNRPTSRLENTIEKVKKQVGFYLSSSIERMMMEEFIEIIAEVLCLRPEGVIYIDGTATDVEFVQAVFQKLTREHVLFARSRYVEVNYEIRKVKDYLRTLLYNVYFEMNPAYTNQVAAGI